MRNEDKAAAAMARVQRELKKLLADGGGRDAEQERKSIDLRRRRSSRGLSEGGEQLLQHPRLGLD